MQNWRTWALIGSMVLVTEAFAQDESGFESTTVTAEESEVFDSESIPSEIRDVPKASRARINSNAPQDRDMDSGRFIELRSAIEEALRKNPLEQIRGNTSARLELERDDMMESFWLPTISLDLNSSNQRFDRIYSSQNQPPGLGSQVSPNGTFGITIKDYTVFNWGRDYLAYQNQKNIIKRETQRLTEARRRLRFSVINQYFTLVRAKEVMKIKREQLRQSSFIHRLAREKLQLRKIPAMEYYQTRSEFLRSQTEYQQSLFDVGQEEEKMANLLGDDYRPSYKTVEQLRFTSVGTTNDEALKQAMNTSPFYRDAKVAYENAQRFYEKTIKDNLPLPKFSVGVGSYQQQFAPQGNNWLRDSGTGRNVEMVAAVNMSWTLVGDGGLFNSRINKRAYLDKRIAEIDFFNAKREIEVRIKTIINTIRFLEQKVTIAEYQDKNARSNLDSTLNSYTTGRSSFPQIKLSLDNWVISGINREDVKLDHLRKKIELADVMGLDDLPGTNFETLAVR